MGRDFFEITIATAVLVFVGVIIGLIGLVIRFLLDYQNTPDYERRKVLLDEISRMRQQGKSYNERLKFLREQGLRRNVADEILADDIKSTS